MDNIMVSTAFVFSKKDLIRNGIGHIFDAVNESLSDKLEPRFVDLIHDDLKESDNAYKFTLTIQRLESE
jgi:hypothetical protein